jgi:hypothetical protein
MDAPAPAPAPVEPGAIAFSILNLHLRGQGHKIAAHEAAKVRPRFRKSAEHRLFENVADDDDDQE